MKTLIIIPTYNEKENIRKIVSQLLAISEQINILIIDDNSPDGTGKITNQLAAADLRVAVIHRQSKLGLGSAYITGFKYALANNMDYIFEMDADFSHDPKYIPDFLQAIKNSDVVVGSRYTGGFRVVNWPLSRLIISYGGSLYTRMITGLPVKDATAGFACYRKKVLENINLDQVHSDGYSFQIEMKYSCWQKGYRITEIPIVFTDRIKGTSKMSYKIVIEALFVVWRLRWHTLRQQTLKLYKRLQPKH